MFSWALMDSRCSLITRLESRVKLHQIQSNDGTPTLKFSCSLILRSFMWGGLQRRTEQSKLLTAGTASVWWSRKRSIIARNRQPYRCNERLPSLLETFGTTNQTDCFTWWLVSWCDVANSTIKAKLCSKIECFCLEPLERFGAQARFPLQPKLRLTLRRLHST